MPESKSVAVRETHARTAIRTAVNSAAGDTTATAARAAGRSRRGVAARAGSSAARCGVKALPYRFAALALLAGLAAGAGAQPQPTLARIDMQAGIHLIKAEVASEDATRARGLMFRERLGPNEGMLFVFADKSRQCFWMRNTLIALSIAFIDDDGSIVNIEDMAPKTEDSHCSAKPIRYALEMEQGWFGKRGVKPGFRMSGPQGRLAPR